MAIQTLTVIREWDAAPPATTEYQPGPAGRPDAPPLIDALVLLRCAGAGGLILAAALASKTLGYLSLPFLFL